jgi:hypothetical protein
MHNHPNFGNPDSSITSGTFGTIQSTAVPASSPMASSKAQRYRDAFFNWN